MKMILRGFVEEKIILVNYQSFNTPSVKENSTPSDFETIVPSSVLATYLTADGKYFH